MAPDMTSVRAVKMTFDNVLVEPEVVTQSKGGIIIPGSDQNKQRPVIGKIIGIGPGVERDGEFVKTSHSIGQRVLFSQYPRSDVDLDGKLFYAISERQILGTFDR